MARDLEADLQMLQRVLALAQARQIDAAAAMARVAVDEGFEHPLLLNVLATQLEQQGDLAGALTLLRRGVEVAPEDIPVRNALALCLQRLQRPAEALGHLDEILSRDASLGYVHAGRGNALVALGRLGEAHQALHRALALDSENVAAMSALASIATHRGEHAEARVWAERTLARVPGLPDAVMSLAAAEIAGGNHRQAETLIRSVLKDSRAGTIDRARALGLLGDVLDADGRYPEAFQAYAEGNRLRRAFYAALADEPSVLDYSRSLGAALRVVAPRWRHHSVQARTGRAREHVFLLGFPRSGTTLLEVVLDGHPDVVSLEEHELLTDGVLRYLREPLDLSNLEQAGEQDLAELRRRYWESVSSGGVAVKGRVFIDKHPLNTLKLPLIARLFPDAKILFACRDPRDVVLSCFRRRFQMNAAMYQFLTLEGTARFYESTMTFADLCRTTLGLAWRDIRFERVMADFNGEMNAICAFLGLTWNESMGKFADRVRRREHATPSTAQLASGLRTQTQAPWRNYEGELGEVMTLIGPWVARYGAADA